MRRHRVICVAVLLNCATLAACGKPPDVPKDCLGRPIDPAHPPQGAASLSWESPTRAEGSVPASPPVGFRVYYGITPEKLLCQIEIREPGVRRAQVTGLSKGTWYFAVVSFDADSIESEPSPVVSKQIE